MTTTNTNSVARIIVRESFNQTKIHEYTPLTAKTQNNGRKKPDEFECMLPMSCRVNISDTIHYVEDVVDLTYLDAIWDFQLSVRDERGYNYDVNYRAENSITCNTVIATDNCFLNGLQYIAITGTKPNNTQFDRSGTDAQTAADLADSINNDTRKPDVDYDVVAVIDPNDDNKILLQLLPSGAAGNLVTLTSNDDATLTKGDTVFFNGTDADLPNSRFTEAITGKFQGNYMLDFQTAGAEVDIPTINLYQTGNGQGVFRKWDLDGMFDIDLWFTPENDPGQGAVTDPTLFSYRDANYGIEIRIEEDGSTGFWYIKMLYATGTTFTTIKGTTAPVFEEGVTNDIPRHIRVMRGGDNIIRMFAMGLEDATNAGVVSASLENPTTPVDHIRLGSDNGGTLDFDGYFNQLRIYSGNVLTEGEYFKILGTKAQPIHMKFGGNVWDKKDSTTTKKILAQSYSKDLNNFKITLAAITRIALTSVARGIVGGSDAFYTGSRSAISLGSNISDMMFDRTAEPADYLYIIEDDDDVVTQYVMVGDNIDLRTLQLMDPTETFDVSSQDSSPSGIHSRGNVNDTNWFMVGGSSTLVHKYKMGTEFRISTSVVQGGESYNYSAQTSGVSGIHINGAHMYISNSDTIFEYTLSTGYNPSTASFTNEFDTGNETTTMTGFDIDTSGFHLYVIGTDLDKIYHYLMSTQWDITTCVLQDTFTVDPQMNFPKAVIIDEPRFLAIDSGNPAVYKYQQRENHSLSAANRYGAGEMDDIIADLLNNLDPTYLVRTLAPMPTQWNGSFLADGTFSEIANILLVRGELTFYINARKVLIIEKSVQSGNDQITNHQFYQIDPTVNTRTAGGQSLGGTAGVFHPYKISDVKVDDGKLVNEITILGARDQTGTIQVTNKKQLQEGDTVHSLRINIPQLADPDDLDDVRDAVLDLADNVKPSYKVESPIAIHHVRYNHLVKIFNDMINIDGAIDGYLKVEAIESNYPSGKTIITVNQFPINFFELSGTESKQVEGLQSESAIPIVFLPADTLE